MGYFDFYSFPYLELPGRGSKGLISACNFKAPPLIGTKLEFNFYKTKKAGYFPAKIKDSKY